MKINFKYCVLSIVFLASNIFAGPASKIVEVDTNKVIAIVSDKNFQGDANKENRRAAIGKVLDESFDFTEMSKRSLGKQWKTLNQDQQNEFVNLFKMLLKKTYISKMEMYNNQKIEIGKEQETDGKITVETSIELKSGKVMLIYKLYQKDNAYRVYDVIIEGVGLIQNYRSQFKTILDEQNYDALVKKLNETINE